MVARARLWRARALLATGWLDAAFTLFVRLYTGDAENVAPLTTLTYSATLPPDHSDNAAAVQALAALELAAPVAQLYGSHLSTQLALGRTYFLLHLAHYVDPMTLSTNPGPGGDAMAASKAAVGTKCSELVAQHAMKLVESTLVGAAVTAAPAAAVPAAKGAPPAAAVPAAVPATSPLLSQVDHSLVADGFHILALNAVTQGLWSLAAQYCVRGLALLASLPIVVAAVAEAAAASADPAGFAARDPRALEVAAFFPPLTGTTADPAVLDAVEPLAGGGVADVRQYLRLRLLLARVWWQQGRLDESEAQVRLVRADAVTVGDVITVNQSDDLRASLLIARGQLLAAATLYRERHQLESTLLHRVDPDAEGKGGEDEDGPLKKRPSLDRPSTAPTRYELDDMDGGAPFAFFSAPDVLVRFAGLLWALLHPPSASATGKTKGKAGPKAPANGGAVKAVAKAVPRAQLRTECLLVLLQAEQLLTRQAVQGGLAVYKPASAHHAAPSDREGSWRLSMSSLDTEYVEELWTAMAIPASALVYGATRAHWLSSSTRYLPALPTLLLCKNMLASVFVHFASLTSDPVVESLVVGSEGRPVPTKSDALVVGSDPTIFTTDTLRQRVAAACFPSTTGSTGTTSNKSTVRGGRILAHLHAARTRCQQAEQIAAVTCYPSPWLLMALDHTMAICLGRLQQVELSQGSTGAVVPSTLRDVVRPSCYRRLLSTALTATQFGQRVDAVRGALLAAAHMLTTTTDPTLAGVGSRNDNGTVAVSATLAHVAAYFLVHSARAYDVDLGIVQRLDELTTGAGGAPLKLNAGQAAQLPSPMLVCVLVIAPWR